MVIELVEKKNSRCSQIALRFTNCNKPINGCKKKIYFTLLQIDLCCLKVKWNLPYHKMLLNYFVYYRIANKVMEKKQKKEKNGKKGGRTWGEI